jgi:hypothetical protein
MPAGLPDFLAAVSFPTLVTGYVAGASGAICKTTDQGESWFQQPSGTFEFLWSIQFPVDEQTGYAVGRNGTIVKTSDGGGAVEEAKNLELATTSVGPTVVRGALFLPEAPGRRLQAARLLDASGRRALDLHAGANDVSRLAPGVYFCVLESGGNRISRKVVLTQ